MKVAQDTQKWYKVFLKLPKIVLITTIIIGFIYGIIDSTVFVYTSGYGYSKTTIYGTLQVSSGFLNWFLWQLIFVADAFINYFVLKIIMSPTILKVEYLKLIAKKQEAYKEYNTPVKNAENSERTIIFEKKEQVSSTSKESEKPKTEDWTTWS